MSKQKSPVVRELVVIVSILSLLGLGALSVFGDGGLLHLREKQARFDSQQRTLHQVESENRRLRERIQNLEKDPGTIEKEIRNRLIYTRPGEKVYQVTGKEGKP